MWNLLLLKRVINNKVIVLANFYLLYNGQQLKLKSRFSTWDVKITIKWLAFYILCWTKLSISPQQLRSLDSGIRCKLCCIRILQGLLFYLYVLLVCICYYTIKYHSWDVKSPLRTYLIIFPPLACTQSIKCHFLHQIRLAQQFYYYYFLILWSFSINIYFNIYHTTVLILSLILNMTNG